VKTKWSRWTVPIAAVALGLAVATPADASGAPGWRITETTANYSAFIGSDALSSTDAWAVGAWTSSAPPSDERSGLRGLLSAAAASAKFTGLVRHYNGKTWQSITAPKALDGTTIPEAVAATSATDAWVVGLQSSSVIAFPTTATLAHWNGQKWNTVDTLPGMPADVVAVNAKDYWAFGFAFTKNSAGFVAWHYNGAKWTTSDSPTVVSGATEFGGTVWTVGDSQSTGDFAVQYLKGSAWETARIPSIAVTSSEFLAPVAITSDGGQNLWVSAEVDNGNTVVKDIVLHDKAGKWSTVTAPAAVARAGSIGTTAPDGAGGLWLTVNTSAGTEKLYHYAASGSWTPVAIPALKGDVTDVTSLSRIPGTSSVWGTGYAGPSSGATSEGLILKNGA
jgi:hypothetical protein